MSTSNCKEQQNNVWILIPARGGSKGIPRKNLRLLDNKPLILHSLENIRGYFSQTQVIISTDDAEIKAVTEHLATLHHRPSYLANDSTTLDEVAVAVSDWLIQNGANPQDPILTIQPTSPFIQVQTILEGLKLLNDGAKSIITVRDDRHLRWTIDKQGNPAPLFAERLNRQWLPVALAETGGLIGSRIGDILDKQTRLVQPVALLEVSSEEGLDIDDYRDWAVAEFLIRRKRIVIRSDGSPALGMGHVYRAIALAQELNEHQLTIVTKCEGENRIGADFLLSQPYPVKTIEDEAEFLGLLEDIKPHITILDVLDTSETYMQKVKSYSQGVVSLEDLGPGARLADVVINDLYTDLYPQHNHWYGVQNAILSSHFETIHAPKKANRKIKKIIVAFGGTDPQNLTIKTLSALKDTSFEGEVTVVLGPGYLHKQFHLSSYQLKGTVKQSVKNMALLMQTADLAITSAGRTVTELMTLGIPTLVMCQNIRELRHTHASSPFGVINLGLGEHVAVSTLAQHIMMLLNDHKLRQDMQQRALQATQERSNRKIAQRILAVATK